MTGAMVVSLLLSGFFRNMIITLARAVIICTTFQNEMY